MQLILLPIDESQSLNSYENVKHRKEVTTLYLYHVIESNEKMNVF